MEFHDAMREIGSGKLVPIYFFFGEEVYFIDQLLNCILEKGVAPETKDFNFDVFQGENTDGESIVGQALSFPMMAERRVIVVKSIQKMSVSDKNRLTTYVESPLDSTVLVLTAGKIDRRQKFYATLTKNSCWVECKPLYENQAIDWVKRYFSKKGLDLSGEGATLLVSLVGTSLWALHNEAEKLITFAWGKKSISIEDVSAVVGFYKQYNTWDLTDAVGRKDLKTAFVVLKRILDGGQSPTGLIIELCRRVILLRKIRTMIDTGTSDREIMSVLGLSPYFAKLYLNQARQFSIQELKAAVPILLYADLYIKTGYMKTNEIMTLSIYNLIRGIRNKSHDSG